MKKSKFINLVLVSATLSSCGNWQSTMFTDESAACRDDSTYHPIYWLGNDNINLWNRTFIFHPHPSQPGYYAPRQSVSTYSHHAAITRGGFGGTAYAVSAHGGGMHSAGA